MTEEDVRAQCTIVSTPTRQGGQYVGTDPMLITITHIETGLSITLPQISRRSQHLRIREGLTAMHYLLEAL